MASSHGIYDVCVIGAGVEGSSTARYLASRGKKTLLLEQFPLPHCHGSSHGATRLVRHGYSNHIFSDLMPEAFALWADVEKKAGKQLIKRVGLLSVEGLPYNNISKLAINVRNLGVKCELLSPEEIKKRFPVFNLPPEYHGTFEPDGGFILANQALQALQHQFVEFGGTLCDGEKVEDIEPGNVVKIRTSKAAVYQARSVVITAGPWVNEVLKPLGLSLPVEIWRVVLSYWEPSNPKNYSIESGFPGFIFYGNKDNDVYGFPMSEYPGLVKICNHSGIPIDRPQARDDARKNEKYTTIVSDFVTSNFFDINPDPKILEACMYTVTPDNSFLLDHHPLHNNIVIGAGFSGHGFKMAPLVGKILSQLALGENPSYDMIPFKMSRFKTPKASL